MSLKEYHIFIDYLRSNLLIQLCHFVREYIMLEFLHHEKLYTWGNQSAMLMGNMVDGFDWTIVYTFYEL